MITPLPRLRISGESHTCRQMDLFQDYLCNSEIERAKLSHVFPLWDVIPRYSISARQMADARNENGFLGILKYSFVHDKAEFRVEIHPTLIEEKKKDGSLGTLAYYPTASDEVVEDALIKIAGERGAGFYSDDQKIAGVCFTLYHLRKELSKAKCTKSYDQIIKSLKILAGSIIVIEGEWREKMIKIKSPFFPQFTSVSRAELLECAFHAIRPPIPP